MTKPSLSTPLWKWAILLFLALLLSALVYLPGLGGGFLFDDYPNIVDHQPFRDLYHGKGDWWEVLAGMDSGPTKRPVSMLSFGIQIALTGFDPWAMKAVNLAIHLLNGILLFLLVQRLAFSVRATAGTQWQGGSHGLAALVSLAWLLAPVNLSGVLYVVQRMESLAALFTLAGLLLYVAGRQRILQGKEGGVQLCWAGLLIGILVGGFAKESAFLTPLYAFLLEVFVFRFRNGRGQLDRSLVPLFMALLVLPGLLGGTWILGKVLFGDSGRGIGIGERVLTEGRVLWNYIGWILVPRLEPLGFYHDDYPVSHGWIEPWTTLPSVLGILVVLVAAYRLRRHSPLAALGVWFFFSAHVLTSTVIPLELVFEHRNYVASIGLFLFLFGLLQDIRLPMKTVRLVFAVAFIALSAFLTAVRAATWGDPLLLAMTTASQHPASPRANYELGYTLLLFSRGVQDPRYQLGMQALEHADRLDGSGLLPAQAAVYFSSTNGIPVKDHWWQALEEKVQGELSQQDYNSLYALISCRIKEACRYDAARLGRVVKRAYEHHPRDPYLATFYANYAVNLAGDRPLGLRLMQKAVSLAPRNPDYWSNLAELLIFLRHEKEAAYAIERLSELGRFHPPFQSFTRLRRFYAEVFGRPWRNPYRKVR